MTTFERAKRIIVSPRTEWLFIKQTDDQKQTIAYLLTLAAIPAIANFIGYGFWGASLGKWGHITGSIGFGIRQGIGSYATDISSVFLTALVVNFLAPSFSSTKNFSKALQLVVYSYTPTLIGGIFLVIPHVSILQVLAGLYGLYILYVGLEPMMQTPMHQKPIYFVVTLLVLIILSFVTTSIIGALLLPSGFR